VGPARSRLVEAAPMRDLMVPRLREEPGLLLRNPQRDVPATTTGRVTAVRD